MEDKKMLQAQNRRFRWTNFTCLVWRAMSPGEDRLAAPSTYPAAKDVTAKENEMSRINKSASALIGIATISLLGMSSPVQAQAGQVIASNMFDGRLYELWRTNEGIRWIDAREACESHGATLVSITSAAENEVVASLIDAAIAAGFLCVDPSLRGHVNTWIGLFEGGGVEGAWTWVSGEPFAFTNWGPGEPNNSGGDEDFGMIFCPETGKRGQWNDARSLDPEAPPSRQYVCERPAQSACSGTLALIPNQWALISLPCDPGADNTVADLFADDLSGVYDEDWVMYRRDEALGEYVKLDLGSVIGVGRSYWLFTKLPDEVLTVEGDVNVEADVPLVVDPEGGVANLMGHPFDYDVCWADVLVNDGISLLSLSDADPGGICQSDPSDTSCLMSRVMHKWNGNAYEPFDGQTPGAMGILSPWDGFWVKASDSGLGLRVPATVGSSCEGSAPITLPDGDGPERGWYVRLIAESDSMIDPGNVFGQLPDSVDSYDPHDLIELDPIGERYLTVVFPHDEWGARSGDYSTDFRALLHDANRHSWSFEVWASPDVQRVTLRWEGPSEVLRASVVVDELTGRRIQIRPGGSTTFSVEGGMHPFTWHFGGIPNDSSDSGSAMPPAARRP